MSECSGDCQGESQEGAIGSHSGENPQRNGDHVPPISLQSERGIPRPGQRPPLLDEPHRYGRHHFAGWPTEITLYRGVRNDWIWLRQWLCAF